MTEYRDLQKQLDELQDMVDENRVILKKIDSRMAWGRAFKIFYWILIIGLSVFGYLAAQPYLNDIQDTYQGIQGGIDSVNGLFDKNNE